MSDKKERKLSEEQLTKYIAHNLAINIAHSIVGEKEADLDEAKAGHKRAMAKAARFHADLAAEFHVKPDEIVDEATGNIQSKPEPKKG